MLWSTEDLRGYHVRATDGVLGHVHDILFDDSTWLLRYLVVDTGWLFGRRVLIAAPALSAPNIEMREFPVALTREQIRNSPDIDTDAPVSRQQEAMLHSHYGWSPYWSAASAPGMMPMGGLGLNAPEPEDTIAPPTDTAPGAGPGAMPQGTTSHGDPHLRSARVVTGCVVAATDGEIGHVQDLLIADDWHIRYLVVDTGTWLPGKRVILAPDWVREIDWAGRRIGVNQTRAKVKASPEYNPRAMVDRSYESRLYTHYGQSPYW